MRIKNLLIILFLLPLLASSQEDVKKDLKLGERYYNNEQYQDAIYFYLKADSVKPLNPLDAANLAWSLLNSPDRELEAIPYFEKALNTRRTNHQLIHKNLGTLYHKVFQFDKAIEHFTTYLDNAGREDRFIIYCERMLETCNNAKKIVEARQEYEINPLPYPLSKYNTKNVFTTVDGRVIIFQTQDYTLYKSEIKQGRFQEPNKLFSHGRLEKANLVGISYDAQILYFNQKEKGDFDLYEANLVGLTIKKPKAFPGEINSKFNEYDLTISPDGTTMYFSSDRPGGYGKTDIYRINRISENDWGTAENIGPEINTPYLERAPFLQASGKYFYFASTGHENMGGFDIFKSTKTGISWSNPENVAFINTIYDDLSFSQTGNGNFVVFSRPKDFEPEEEHLWSVNLSQNIPLTIVKGTILAGSPLSPVAADIKVYDQETKERMKYIYNPNPHTGKYLMIFPPGKDYEMVVEADGFLPQLIQIVVPGQKYFYELFQEIRLYTIELAEEKIGEKVEVENVFYDIYQTNLSDSLIEKYKPQREKNYDHLLKMVEDIINTTDSIGIENINEMREAPKTSQNEQQESYDHLVNLIETAISNTDSVSLALLDKQTVENEETSNIYFYSSNQLPHEYLDKTVYNGDTLYTKPRLNTNKEKQVQAEDSKYDFNYRALKAEEKRVVMHKTIYFDVNEVQIKTKYLFDISQITDLLYNNASLGIEIHGYADERGTARYNEQLSRRRANEVFKKIQSNRIKSNRIIIEAHGEEDLNRNKGKLAKSRRVDIVIFEPIIQSEIEK
ncbi:OmpA family protein [Salinivirga cyanobacteriivorans]